MTKYPRVKAVQAAAGKTLRVTFDNGKTRMYDCTPLLQEEAFRRLNDEGFFRNVTADPHGYGVSWSDEVDLAEAELWEHGVVEEATATNSRQAANKTQDSQ